MGLRFRKSIKIAQGIRLNVGKKSVGVSIGGKHGGVSINSRTGKRVRASLPGTGLSYTASLNGEKAARQRKSRASMAEYQCTEPEGNVSVEDLMLIDRTDEQDQMIRNGCKEDIKHRIFPPDTVWAAGPHAKVYHVADGCDSGILLEGIPLTEIEAVRRGMRRCKKCSWAGCEDVPAPAATPAGPVEPVSVVTLRPADQTPKKAPEEIEAELAQKRREKAKKAPRQPTDEAGVKSQAKVGDGFFIVLALVLSLAFRNFVVWGISALALAVSGWDFWRSFKKTDEVIAENIEKNRKLDIEAGFITSSEQ